MNCELREKVISNLISSKPNDEYIEKFKNTYDEFREFMKKVTIKEEGEIVLKLENIKNELILISAFASLFKKNIITIGGGFSAGKSEFINSFILNAKLPVNIDPTTAIATYVLKGDDEIVACNYKGAKVNLKKIDEKFLSILSHEFINSFKFNIKEILNYLVVGVDIDYENICFVDTPGYNPSNKDEDLDIAVKYLKNNETLIWLIGLDRNGTIPSSDLEFLEKLSLENKKFYLVFNKADLRNINDLEDILEDIQDVLDDYSIQYEGISFYSSILKEEFLYDKVSLFEFLAKENYEKLKIESILNDLKRIYLTYKLSLKKEEKEKNEIYKVLHSLSIDLVQEALESENVYMRIEDLKNYFRFTKKKLFNELDEIFINFEKALRGLFKSDISLDLDVFIEDVDVLEDISIQVENLLNGKIEDDEIEFDF